MPENAFGYNRPHWGLHYCPWDAFCRDAWEGTENVVGSGTGGLMPWLYVHTPWFSLIFPITLNRANWPYDSSWHWVSWIKHVRQRT